MWFLKLRGKLLGLTMHLILAAIILGAPRVGAAFNIHTTPLPAETRVLYMMINFEDNLEEPYTLAQFQQLAAYNLSYFEEIAPHPMTIETTVAGYVTLPVASAGNCDWGQWHNLAMEALEDLGYMVYEYDFRYVVFPGGEASCSFEGTAYIGGPSGALVMSSDQTYHPPIAHEMGHSFELYHSELMLCGYEAGPQAYGPVCGGAGEFISPDPFSMLGRGGSYLTPPHLIQLEVLPEDGIVNVPQNSPGVYTIRSVESGEGPHTLRIPLSYTNHHFHEYYISYARENTGRTADEVAVHEGALVYIWKDPREPRLLNMHPADPLSLNPYRYHEHTLLDGHIYQDPINDVTVRQLSHTEDELTLEVVFEPLDRCEPGGQTFFVRTRHGQSNATHLAFELEFVNHDQGACPPYTVDFWAIANGTGEGIEIEPSTAYVPAGDTLVASVRLPLSLVTGEEEEQLIVVAEGRYWDGFWLDVAPVQTCPADLNGDDLVGYVDLSTLLGHWGTANLDLTGDGVCGMEDLVLLLGRWGLCSA